jgi:hypothetical protein
MLVCPQNFTYNEHIRSVDVGVVRKIAFAVDDHLETHACSSISGVDATDSDEILRGPSHEIPGILVRYLVSFSTTLVP